MTNRHEEMREAARKFHKSNPEVWNLFRRFVFEKINAGYAHYGAGAIMERVRWESDRGAGEPALKINNNFRAFYAREFEELYPIHKGFFRSRVQTSAQRPATGQPEPLRESLG